MEFRSPITPEYGGDVMRIAVMIAIIVAAIALSASAQNQELSEAALSDATLAPVAEALAQRSEFFLRNDVEPVQFDPAMRQRVQSGGAALKLEANSDDKSAVLRFSLDLSRPGSEKSPFLLAFELSSPLAKDSPRTTVATANTLTGMPAGEVGFFWSNKRERAQNIIRTGFAPYVRSLAGGSVVAPAGSELLSLLSASSKAGGSLSTATVSALAEVVNFRQIAQQAASPWFTFAGITGKGGRQRYKFAEPPAYQDAADALTSYSASLVGGRYNAATQRFYTTSLSRVRKYKEQDPVERCEPTSTPNVSKCKTIAGGAPRRQESTIADAVVNWRFAPQFGVAPRVARDFTDNATAVSLPIYFVEGTAKNEKNALNGGVSLEWNTKDRDLVVAIFVGQFAKLPPFLK